MQTRRLTVAALLLCASAVHAQNISYFNQGFLRQPNAALDRAYLGISNAPPMTNFPVLNAPNTFTGDSNVFVVIYGIGSNLTFLNASALAYGMPDPSLFNDVNSNVRLGFQAGLNTTNSTVGSSVYIGQTAGLNASNIFRSVFIGTESGGSAKTSRYITAFGYRSARAVLACDTIACIGQQSGIAAQYATNTIFMGPFSGLACSNTSGSIFIGYYAGSTNSGVDNQLIIDGNRATSGSTNTAFISGDFGLKTLNFSANTTIQSNLTVINYVDSAGGFRVSGNIGLTTNLNVLMAGNTTNQLQFTGGILTGVVPQ